MKTEAKGDGFPAPAARVAIIPAQFDSALSYQENVCADALYRSGYEIGVFTSWSGVAKSTNGAVIGPPAPFPVHRASRVFRVKETQLPWDSSVARALKAFDPDVAFLMAPLHGLGWAWMRLLSPACKVGAFFSDIPWHREGGWIRNRVKRKMARDVFRRADQIYPVTKQTAELLESWGGDLVGAKMQQLGLAVDFGTLEPPHTLPASVEVLRGRVERMGSMVTRVTSVKELHQFFSQIEEYLTEHGGDGFVIAGLNEDGAGQRLRAAVEGSPIRDRVLLLGELSSQDVGAVFRLSDFSLWNSVSIGMYHALASSCPVVLYSGRGSAEHLVTEGVNGVWFHSLQDAPSAMAAARGRVWDPEAIRAGVDFADANKVFPDLVEGLLAPGGQGAT